MHNCKLAGKKELTELTSPVLRLVLNVGGVDGDTTRPLLWGVVNLLQ